MKWVDEITDKAPVLLLNAERVISMLTSSLQIEVEKTGFKRVVIGLSGGIDSALALFLAVKAFGSEQVTAICMPYKTSNPRSLQDAKIAAKKVKVKTLEIDITPQIDAYFMSFKDSSRLRRGNKMARERMSVLYDMSVVENALVIGTSNRTEILLGYGTQFGDTASAINPIGDLYKSQIRQLAEFIGVPEPILMKAPSADLWENQTDEEEIGFSYLDIDHLIYHMVDMQLPEEHLTSMGFTTEFINTIKLKIKRNQFKSRMPLILRVSSAR